MFDPNEAFENEFEDNEYDPIDDDIAFDSDFLNKVSFNEVVAFLDSISEAILRFELNEKQSKNKDWYVEYYNNPGKEVLINIDPGMFEDIENLVDNFSKRGYRWLIIIFKEMRVKFVNFVKQVLLQSVQQIAHATMSHLAGIYLIHFAV